MRLLGQLWAAMVLQVRVLVARPSEAMFLLLVPLQTLTYLAIFRNAGRDDLDGYAIVAPTIMSMWQLSLLISGEVIARARDDRVLEPMVASPARLDIVVVGRVLVVTALSLLALPLAAITGWLVFGVSLETASPWVFALSLATCAIATTCAALLFAVVFVQARSPRLFQNSMSYPFYVLGGVLVPIALYPEWIQPIARAVYLSWSADLLRDAVSLDDVAHVGERNLVVLLLGAAMAVAARVLLAWTMRVARQEARLGISA